MRIISFMIAFLVLAAPAFADNDWYEQEHQRQQEYRERFEQDRRQAEMERRQEEYESRQREPRL